MASSWGEASGVGVGSGAGCLPAFAISLYSRSDSECYAGRPYQSLDTRKALPHKLLTGEIWMGELADPALADTQEGVYAMGGIA